MLIGLTTSQMYQGKMKSKTKTLDHYYTTENLYDHFQLRQSKTLELGVEK